MKKVNASIDEIKGYIYKHNRDVKKIFDEQDERDLVIYIKNISAQKYGLSKKKLRRFVYKYAMANRLTVPHQWIKNELSGLQWTRDFTKKYKKDISLRKPEATSFGRATSFNIQNVKLFFDNLDTAIKKYGLF